MCTGLDHKIQSEQWEWGMYGNDYNVREGPLGYSCVLKSDKML